MKEIYFVTANVRAEVEAIKEIKPDCLLISYFYWKRRFLDKFIKKIGYKPKILLDSGAYSAWKQEKNISLFDYIDYIKENKDYIDEYIMLDVIGKPDITYKCYEIMKMEGLDPTPVYHHGEDVEYLEKFIEEGCDRIALGNTVPIRNKKKVAKWVNSIIKNYPNISFHLLGSSSKKVVQGCPELDSCDSSTYILMAINGHPEHIKTKTGRAKYQMRKILNYLE